MKWARCPGRADADLEGRGDGERWEIERKIIQRCKEAAGRGKRWMEDKESEDC